MRFLSRRARRLAVSVPPTPPPRTRIRSIGLPGLLDKDTVIALEGLDGDEPMAGLLDPLGDVDLGALVGRQDRQDVAHLGLADPADELHERSGAEAAAGIDRPVDGGFGLEHRSVPSRAPGTRRPSVRGGQMNSDDAPLLRRSMTVAAPTGSPSPSIMSSRLRPNMSIVIWQGMNSTPSAWAASSSSVGLATPYFFARTPIIQGPIPRKFIFESLRWLIPGRCISESIFCIHVSPVTRTSSFTQGWGPQKVMKTFVLTPLAAAVVARMSDAQVFSRSPLYQIRTRSRLLTSSSGARVGAGAAAAIASAMASRPGSAVVGRSVVSVIGSCLTSGG